MMERDGVQVDITVHDIGGNFSEVQASAASTLDVLRSAIFRQTGIPCICQQLLVGANILQEEELKLILSQACSNPYNYSDARLHILLIISREEVYFQLNNFVNILPYSRFANREVFACKHLLTCLSLYSAKGEAQALAIVIALCHNWHADIRAEATHVLVSLCEFGNQLGIDLLVRRLQDGGHPCRGSGKTKYRRHPVRLVAAKGLAKISPVGCKQALDQLIACVEDETELDFDVIVTAIETMATLANKGDEHVIDILISACNIEVLSVQRAAILALVQVARPGDNRIIEALLQLCESKHAGLRQFAFSSIRSFARIGDTVAISMTTRHLRSRHSWARVLAVQVMVIVAGKESEEALIALTTQMCRDPNKHVRAAIVGALPEICKPGDPRVLHALQVRMKDFSRLVRHKTADALAKFGTG